MKDEINLAHPLTPNLFTGDEITFQVRHVYGTEEDIRKVNNFFRLDRLSNPPPDPFNDLPHCPRCWDSSWSRSAVAIHVNPGFAAENTNYLRCKNCEDIVGTAFSFHGSYFVNRGGYSVERYLNKGQLWLDVLDYEAELIKGYSE